MIQDGAMIGMGSIVLDRARVGRRTMLTAGSVVTEDGKIPPEVLATGLPQRPRRISTEAPRSGSRAARVPGAPAPLHGRDEIGCYG